MKNLRKTFIFVVSMCIAMFLFTSITVSGATTVKTDDGKYNYTTVTETVTDLATGAQMILNEGYTTRSGVQYDQRVTAYTCDVSANSDIKLATWAIPNTEGTGFIRRDLLTIAQDFEKNNPGWVILGGVNADQYFATLGTGIQTDGSYLYVPQPYYPMITNGDTLFGVSAFGYATFNAVVGFKNDGSSKPFVNGTRSTKGMYIHIYNSFKQEIGSFPIDGLNKTISDGGTTVIASYRNSTDTFVSVSSSGNNDVYVVSNPEMSYVSNNASWTSICEYATDAFFGKGYITEVTKNVTFDSEKGFAIETSNSELKAMLSKGTYIKVQFEFDDEMNGIQEATGYHTVQRLNNKDCNVDNAYNTRAYPRSWFGFDANGKAYLMTCWGDNSSPSEGLYAQEMNAFCKYYGITDAWQMDGGGSVTSVVRGEDGVLKYAEACIEQSHNEKQLAYSEYRYIFSGLFVVMKVANPYTEVLENNGTDVTFSIDTSIVKNKYDGLKIRVTNVNTKVYQDVDVDLSKDSTLVKVSGLVANNEYTYEYISIKNGVEQRGYATKFFASNKAKPIINSITAVKSGSGYNLTIDFSDEDKAMNKLFVKYNDKEYQCEINDGIATVSISDVTSLWDISLEAECVMNKRYIDTSREELEIKGFAYPVEYCFDKILSDFSDMVKGFCR